jgi:hypothetical protein
LLPFPFFAEAFWLNGRFWMIVLHSLGFHALQFCLFSAGFWSVYGPEPGVRKCFFI